ncbi:hypothetical protein FHS29_005387 [Saccharothrix tamanrassetensis]|uniref:PE-PGRS family protein n=1 Tax=Saccharothrix tamanrassetensis TaxID=1051531 RepID=A0A841CRK9_9PSEU|nr:hypothetical protein [Saccharothrix tamanrassetensis]MBB5958778.1 hypothetical protein [Saccharothrix tamanrassetensis]
MRRSLLRDVGCAGSGFAGAAAVGSAGGAGVTGSAAGAGAIVGAAGVIAVVGVGAADGASVTGSGSTVGANMSMGVATGAGMGGADAAGPDMAGLDAVAEAIAEAAGAGAGAEAAGVAAVDTAIAVDTAGAGDAASVGVAAVSGAFGASAGAGAVVVAGAKVIVGAAAAATSARATAAAVDPLDVAVDCFGTSGAAVGGAVGLVWVGLAWVRLPWAVLAWVGLPWVRLPWVGFGWPGATVVAPDAAVFRTSVRFAGARSVVTEAAVLAAGAVARTPDIVPGFVAVAVADTAAGAVAVRTGMAAVVRKPDRAVGFALAEAITVAGTGLMRRVAASLLGWNLLCGGWSGSWLNVTRRSCQTTHGDSRRGISKR